MSQTKARPAGPQAAPEFSLVLGGPLFQIFRRTHLCDDALRLLKRRMFVLTAIAWLPLLVLSVYSGHAFPGKVEIPLLADIETYARYFVALPLLIAAEVIIHRRLKPVVENFVMRGLVRDDELPKFNAMIASTLRWRNSVVLEAALLVFVYTVGHWVWRNNIAVDSASWYATTQGGDMHLTPAGRWWVLVSLPMFQFILLRWYLRYFIWLSLLWRISRLNLCLIPTHPDRTAGLGFLGRGSHAFWPILSGQGAVLAGMIATQIAYEGHNLLEFKVQIVGFIGFFVIAVLAPLLVFTPHLVRASRKGAGEFARLGVRYARRFEEKWLRENPPDEELLGSSDIQSLADLGNSHSMASSVGFVPFGWNNVMALIMAAALPLLPLLFTLFSLEQLADQLLKVIF